MFYNSMRVIRREEPNLSFLPPLFLGGVPEPAMKS